MMLARLFSTMLLVVLFGAPAHAQEFYTPKTLSIDGAWITAIAFSPDGASIAFATDEGRVTLRDVQNEAVVREFTWQDRT
jgi:WD40 repeat protein